MIPEVPKWYWKRRVKASLEILVHLKQSPTYNVLAVLIAEVNSTSKEIFALCFTGRGELDLFLYE